MNLKFIVLSAAAFIQVFGFCLAGTADNNSVQCKLAAQYRQMARAYTNKNLSGFMRPLADDFVFIDLKGSLQNRTDFEESQKGGLEMVQSVNEDRYRINKIIVGKSEAVVSCFSRIDSTNIDNDGSFGKKGKSYRFVASGTSYDRWKYSEGIWKLEYEEIITEKVTINGHSFTPKTTTQYYFNGQPVHSDFTPIRK